MNTKDKLILIGFILFFLLAVAFLIIVNSKGSKCIANPPQYLISQIKPKPIYCECFFADRPNFIFGEDKTYIVALTGLNSKSEII